MNEKVESADAVDDDKQLDVDTTLTKVFSNPRRTIRHGVFQERGRRRSMEDTHFISDEFHKIVQNTYSDLSALRAPFRSQSSYFGLFDGHAGRAAAEYCQLHMHHNIARSAGQAHDICEAMVKGFLLTDEQFLANARKDNEESGSVAVSLIVSDSRIHIAHAGDARAVLCRGGTAVLLTQDHKPTLSQEKERVEQSGGTVEWDMLNGFLEVSRAIGDFDRELQAKTRGLTALPDTQVYELHDDDEFVIVACDGLWDVLDSQAAVQYARAHLLRYNSVDAVCEALVHEALQQHSDDNVTVIVVAFDRPDSTSSSGSRAVAADAEVMELPEHAPAPRVPEAVVELRSPTESSLAQRPRFCASGLSKVKGLLH